MAAGVQGLEPQYSGPKPDVLPLDDTPMVCADFIPYLARLWKLLPLSSQGMRAQVGA